MERLPHVKLMMLGDAQVGKTSIMNRYIEGRFDMNTLCTVAIDFRSKVVQIKNQYVKIQIWDTAGQEKFRYIVKNFYQRAMGIVLVYDVSDRESFEHISFWMQGISENSGDIPVILIANKIDLETRKVTKEEGEQTASKFKCKYYETSAKSGQNINVIYEDLTLQILEKGIHTQTEINLESLIHQGKKEKQNLNGGKKKDCCN